MGRVNMPRGSKIYDYEVRHPDFGVIVVPSIGPDSATVEAAERWGVREQWGQIAACCVVRKLGPAGKPRCRRCGMEYGQGGDPGGLCPFCARAMEIEWKSKSPQSRPQDRRAGVREREARSAREQGTKTGAEARAQGGPSGAGWVLPESQDLGPVAEGAQRDRRERSG